MPIRGAEPNKKSLFLCRTDCGEPPDDPLLARSARRRFPVLPRRAGPNVRRPRTDRVAADHHGDGADLLRSGARALDRL